MRMNLLESLSDNIKVDPAKCTYCGICVDTCILDNLRMKLAPCRGACPLGVNCHGYVRCIARGRDDEGRRELAKALPFPGILGRVCAAPCEDACTRNKEDGRGVSIRALKRWLADTDPEPLPLPDMAPDSGSLAAVVGAGPAGLMAAWELRVRGHQVTVYDVEDEPGGMLRWAIPEFRLPLPVLEREIGRLARMGIAFRCGRALGRDLTLDGLADMYGAVVLATGCPSPRSLGVPGEGLTGVRYALDLLRDVRRGRAGSLEGRVVVVGGGEVALDAAQTALRLGASEVLVACLEGRDQMPVRPEVLAGALEEGVRLACTWGLRRIIAKDGRVAGVAMRRCLSVFDSRGCFAPEYDEAQTCVEQADTVVVAVGQQADAAPLDALCGPRGLEYDPVTLRAGDGKVFVAGDMATGPSSVVHAMAAGREAAVSAHRLLAGEHLSYGREYAGPVVRDFPIESRPGSDAARTDAPRRAGAGRGDFAELEGVLDEEAARREAGRCHSCGGPFGMYRTCWFCLPLRGGVSARCPVGGDSLPAAVRSRNGRARVPGHSEEG